MLDYDMLDVEACGLKDEDQGHYPCSVWGEGEKEQDTGEGPSMTEQGKPGLLKNEDI